MRLELGTGGLNSFLIRKLIPPTSTVLPPNPPQSARYSPQVRFFFENYM